MCWNYTIHITHCDYCSVFGNGGGFKNPFDGQEVGGVGVGWRLIGDWPMAQRHANDGCHVSLGPKHMDGNASGLSCRRRSKFKHMDGMPVGFKG